MHLLLVFFLLLEVIKIEARGPRVPRVDRGLEIRGDQPWLRFGYQLGFSYQLCFHLLLRGLDQLRLLFIVFERASLRRNKRLLLFLWCG